MAVGQATLNLLNENPSRSGRQLPVDGRVPELLQGGVALGEAPAPSGRPSMRVWRHTRRHAEKAGVAWTHLHPCQNRADRGEGCAVSITLRAHRVASAKRARAKGGRSERATAHRCLSLLTLPPFFFDAFFLAPFFFFAAAFFLAAFFAGAFLASFAAAFLVAAT